MKKNWEYLPIILPLLAFSFSYCLPFWGDSIASVSIPATNIYKHHLLTVWNLPHADPGHPTLLPYLIATGWTIMGHTLWVPHLLVSLFCMGILWMVVLLTRFFNPDQPAAAVTAAILAAVSPCFVSMNVSISLHTPLTFFFLLALYALLTQRNRLLVTAAALMMLCHLEAVFLLAALAIIHLYREESFQSREKFLNGLKRHFFHYAIPFLVLCCWLGLHYLHAGWVITAPAYAAHREISGMKDFLVHIGLSAWRIADYGYLVFFIPVLAAFSRRKATPPDYLLLLLTVVLVTGISLFFSNSPAHRYFFPVYMLAIIVFSGYVYRLATRKNAWLAVAFAAIVAGNFMYYPGKTLGDVNTSYLHYYAIEKQVMTDHGAANTYYSYAPLNNSWEYTTLDSTRGIRHGDLYQAKLGDADYVLQSNLNGEFTPEELAELENNWAGYSYESGPVYVNVYVNKKRVQIPATPATSKRTPGKLENWISHWKEKLKGR